MASPDPSLNCEISAGGFLHSALFYRDLSSLHLAKIMIISEAEIASYPRWDIPWLASGPSAGSLHLT